MSNSQIGKVVDSGKYWKLTLHDDEEKHLVSKHISNKQKPGILTKVNVDITPDKKVKTSVSEVLYPKWKYNKSDIESVSDKILNSSKDDCPMCEKIKNAISVNEIPRLEDKIGLPRPEDIIPSPNDILEPLRETHRNIIEAINSTIDMFNPALMNRK